MDPEVNVGQGVFTNPITAAFREIGHTDPSCIAKSTSSMPGPMSSATTST
jgi:hypothetical protein